MRTTLITAVALLVMTPASALAQPAPGRAAITFGGGYAGFLDDAVIHHGVAAAGVEWVVRPRLAIGPEVLYMVGPGSDRDVFVLGVVRVGIRPFSTGVAPYVVAGGGLMHHRERLGGRAFSQTAGAFIAGGGVRVHVSPRVFVAPEVTVGWEPHLRAAVHVGVALP